MTDPTIRPRLIDGEKLNRLVNHLLDEADFNRSWTDGRRSPGANVASVYTERRIEAAEEREEWARQVEGLRRLLAEAREERDAARRKLCGIGESEYGYDSCKDYADQHGWSYLYAPTQGGGVKGGGE